MGGEWVSAHSSLAPLGGYDAKNCTGNIEGAVAAYVLSMYGAAMVCDGEKIGL